MKKILSLILALVMIFAMATTAFAEETEETEGATTPTYEFTITTSDSENANAAGSKYSWNIDVPAALDEVKPENEENVAANYFVVVEWSIESELVYKIGLDAYSWNIYSGITTDEETGDVTKVKYGEDENDTTVDGAGYEIDYSKGIWSGVATITVSVTNWSNRALSATVGFDAAKKDTDVNVVADIAVADEALTIKVEDEAVNEISIPSASSNINTIENGAYTTSAGTVEATITIDADTTMDDGSKAMTGGINKDNASIGTVTITLTGFKDGATVAETDENTELTVETTPLETEPEETT